jgi:hypothetical protein
MRLMLEHLEHHRQVDAHDVILLARCIEKCRRAMDDIERLVDNLEERIENYWKIGGQLYAALKDPT